MLRTLLARPVRRADPPARSRWLAVLPLLLVALLYVGASVGPAVFDQNEAQYAGAVREMMDRPQDYVTSTRGRLERGQWYVPTNDGIPRLQKPPLVYWFLMGSMRVFGVNEFAARLPNALFSLLWFGGTFLLGRRMLGNRYGVAAATILATMAGTFIFSHLIAPEPFLAAFLTLTFWCFLCACQEPAEARKWMFRAWLCMGLGVGSKGLHGALYPLAVAGILAWRHPATRPVWRQLWRPAGPLLVLAVLVPWYAAIELRYPGFLRDQFLNEQWGHVVNNRYPLDSNRVPLSVFCLEHLILFLPWTFFIPVAWRARRAGGEVKAASFVQADVSRDLLRAWFGVTAVSLLFSSLQDYYLMTAWGPVALWLAKAWVVNEGEARCWPRWMRLGPGWCLTGVGVLTLLAAVFLTLHQVGGAPATAMGATPTSDRDTILATLAGFSVSAWHRLLPLVWVTGGLFAVGGVGTMFLAAGGRWRLVLPTTAIMMMGTLVMAARGLTVLEDYFSLKQIALQINRRAGADATVVCAGEPCDNPSLLFYLNREIHWFHAQASREFASRELKIGDGLFLSDDEFTARWNSGQAVYFICEEDELGPWREKLQVRGEPPVQLSQHGTRLLLWNGQRWSEEDRTRRQIVGQASRLPRR